MVKNLIIANAVMFFAAHFVFKNTSFSSMAALNAISYKDAAGNSMFMPWQLITHLFMHADASHLIFNMLGLWIFGSKLENFWGPKRFLIFYIVTGIIASIIQLAYHQYDYSITQKVVTEFANNPTYGEYKNILSKYYRKDGFKLFDASPMYELLQAWEADANSGAVRNNAISILQSAKDIASRYSLIGASGAVMACMGGAAYLFPNTQIMFNMFFPIALKYAAVLYIGYDLYQMYMPQYGDNTAHLAHIAGMLAGLTYAFIINKTNKKTFY